MEQHTAEAITLAAISYRGRVGRGLQSGDSALIRDVARHFFFFDGDCQATTDQCIRHMLSPSRRNPAT